MAIWHIGTMGFSYPDWRGVFYPRELGSQRFLSYYSRIFNSLEIDSTFYGIPRKSTVLGWKHTVPADFTFCLKTPQAITHRAGLEGAGQLFLEFITAARYLEGNLGAILLQFPPSFRSDKLHVLGDFLARLPAGIRCAVELRHQSWYTAGSSSQSVGELLKQLKVCWASIEYPDVPGSIMKTSDFLYLRWIGQHGTFQQHDSERLDRTQNMQGWLEKIARLEPQVEAVLGFFNNDYAGFAVGSALRFKQLASLPIVEVAQPVQGQLF